MYRHRQRERKKDGEVNNRVSPGLNINVWLLYPPLDPVFSSDPDLKTKQQLAVSSLFILPPPKNTHKHTHSRRLVPKLTAKTTEPFKRVILSKLPACKLRRRARCHAGVPSCFARWMAGVSLFPSDSPHQPPTTTTSSRPAVCFDPKQLAGRDTRLV